MPRQNVTDLVWSKVEPHLGDVITEDTTSEEYDAEINALVSDALQDLNFGNHLLKRVMTELRKKGRV